MTIPSDSKPNCPECEKHTHTYDLDCRACFVRSIAHMPIRHRGALYLRITQHHGHQIMSAISEAVTKYYQVHKSWGTSKT